MTEPNMKTPSAGQRIHWPLFIAGAMALVLLGLILVFLGPRFSGASAADEELRAYLYRVVIAQARYLEQNRSYATSLEALRQHEESLRNPKTPKVLEPAPASYRFNWQFVNEDDYCLIAAREGGERWYTVSAAGARRSQTSASETFTGTCPALRKPS